jgi:hypothetical protein
MGITITGPERDALFAVIVSNTGDLLDLEQATLEEDWEACHRLGRRVADGLRLIVDGGLEWGDETSAEEVQLSLPPADLRRILSELHSCAVHLQEAVRPEYEEKLAAWKRAQLAVDACTSALDQIGPAGSTASE